MFTFSRLQFIRSLGILFAKKPSATSYRKGNSWFGKVNADGAVETLRRDGVCLGINIPHDVLQDILKFANTTNYLGNSDANLPFSFASKQEQEAKHDKSFLFGYHHSPSTLCPAVKQLENDPKLWEIAAKYLIAEPVLAGSMMWWSFATSEAQIDKRREFAQGLFHYDLEDYRCLKFMFYLTDVDLSSGPHAYVKGSHERKKLQHQLSLIRARSDEELINYYGKDTITTICEKAGFGFAEDPFCFHRGIIPTQKNRLILEVKFAISKYKHFSMAK